jgi:hypothetical protein
MFFLGQILKIPSWTFCSIHLLEHFLPPKLSANIDVEASRVSTVLEGEGMAFVAVQKFPQPEDARFF